MRVLPLVEFLRIIAPVLELEVPRVSELAPVKEPEEALRVDPVKLPEVLIEMFEARSEPTMCPERDRELYGIPEVPRVIDPVEELTVTPPPPTSKVTPED